MRDDEWEADDEDSDDSAVTVPCPYCGEEMLEDAPQCPACGNYVSDVDRPRERKPPWILIGIVICLVIALAWAVGM
jgi:hypothetical protein